MMIKESIRNGLQKHTTALLRQRNPGAAESTTTATTKTFRFPIHVDQLTINDPPTDASGTILPFVVLYDVAQDKVFATWSDVQKSQTPDAPIPKDVDISQTWLIAARNEADWKAVRASLPLGGNGEPGTASNGGSMG